MAVTAIVTAGRAPRVLSLLYQWFRGADMTQEGGSEWSRSLTRGEEGLEEEDLEQSNQGAGIEYD